MINIIIKIFEALNMIKGFTVGYSSRNVNDGYFMIDYNDKRYAVKIVEIKNPSMEASRDLDRLQYHV